MPWTADNAIHPEPEVWIEVTWRDARDCEIDSVGSDAHFYLFQPSRPTETIDADLKACTDRLEAMMVERSA